MIMNDDFDYSSMINKSVIEEEQDGTEEQISKLVELGFNIN